MKSLKMKNAKKILAFLIVIALALQLLPVSALAAGGDGSGGGAGTTPYLVAVRLNATRTELSGNALTLDLGSTAEGIKPRIVLEFRNNVSGSNLAAGILDNNLDHIYMVEITKGGDFVKYIQTSKGACDPNDFITGPSDLVGYERRGIFIAPNNGLLEGYYKIVIEPGITANNGNSTTEEYDVYFQVGDPDASAGDDGAPIEETREVLFSVSGIPSSVEPLIVVKNEKTAFYADDSNALLYNLPDGNYTYSVGAEGYASTTGRFTVNGKNTTVGVSLVDYSIVKINTNPAGAEVVVKSGQSDTVPVNSNGTFTLSPGKEYTYVCTLAGYEVASRRFTPVYEYDTITVPLTPMATPSDVYGAQGVGGNTLTLLAPDASRISIGEVTENYYYNLIDGEFDNTDAISFSFTMSAGMGNFKRESFISTNLPRIGVYTYNSVGQKGEKKADSENGLLTYHGFEAESKQITLSIPAGTLEDGKYVLYFGKDICGNNTSKTLGKPVMFEFSVKNSGTEPNPVVIPDSGFVDTKGHWAEEAISYVVEKGLFYGTGANRFEPEKQMTRAMLMTVLARFDGVDTSGGSVWYEKGLNWAIRNSISDGSNPEANITREQLATMLYRYMQAKGYDVSEGANYDLSAFPDSAKIDAYAVDAMKWACACGIIKGMGDGSVNPLGNATRAQVATMIMRLDMKLSSLV